MIIIKNRLVDNVTVDDEPWTQTSKLENKVL